MVHLSCQVTCSPALRTLASSKISGVLCLKSFESELSLQVLNDLFRVPLNVNAKLVKCERYFLQNISGWFSHNTISHCYEIIEACLTITLRSLMLGIK